jgi:N-acyl homoserine lactone hydrolase
MTANNATPQRLYLLQLSTATVPLGGGRTLAMVNVAYLVAMSDGTYILIDSGLPADYAPPGMPPSHDTKNVLAHLAELGLTPDDIDTVICTHFDVDHAGFHDAFPQAEFVVQRRHDKVARSGNPRYTPARPHWDHPALRYRLVDGDVELFPGLWLIESSGHAPGHQSVLVSLPNSGAILLAIDAVVIAQLFTPERQAWPTDDNQEELRASTRKLLDLVGREGVQLVVFGHDGRQWQTLVKAPAYYD